MIVDIKILWNYFCEYKISSFSLYIKPYGIIFHNKIPKKDIYGNEQFNDKKEFIMMLNNFISNIRNKKDDLSHWLNKSVLKKYMLKNILKIFALRLIREIIIYIFIEYSTLTKKIIF